MFSSIFSKTLYTLRWQIVGWGLVIGLVALITISVFDSFSQGSFQQIVGSIPESLKGFVGTADDYNSIAGFLGQQVFGLKIAMFAIIMAIMLFIGTSASEEDDGRLHTLISLPVSRTKIYFQKWFAVLVVIGLVSLFLALATLAGLAIIGKTVAIDHMLESVFSFWLIAACYGTVAYGAAMLIGKKGPVTAIAGGYAVFGVVISSLASSVTQLKDLDMLSLLHYYTTPAVMQHGLDMGNMLVLVSALLVFSLIGWIGFNHRSIGT